MTIVDWFGHCIVHICVEKQHYLKFQLKNEQKFKLLVNFCNMEVVNNFINFLVTVGKQGLYFNIF